MTDSVTIGWSEFAAGRHRPGEPYSYYTGNPQDVIDRVRESWGYREFGDGSESLDDVCVIQIPADGFRCGFVHIDRAKSLNAEVVRRQEHEAPYVRVTADGAAPEEARFVKVVLYAAHELEKNGGTRSTDCEWEIVCIIASPAESEPMHPLAMARNQLEKPGGTPRHYTSEEWAEAVWYWSQYVPVRGTL